MTRNEWSKIREIKIQLDQIEHLLLPRGPIPRACPQCLGVTYTTFDQTDYLPPRVDSHCEVSYV